MLALLRAELLAAGGIEHGAAAVDDAADTGVVHRHDVPVDKAAPAPADPHALNAPAQGRADHGANTGVHARSIAATGEDADPLYFVFHTHYPFRNSFLGFPDYSIHYVGCESFFIAVAAGACYT